MKTALDHPAVLEYLQRLDAATSTLPPGRRGELAAEIRSHLQESLAELSGQDDAAVRQVLARLGAPEDIVAAESPEGLPAGRPPSPWGAVEVGAVLGLTAGAFVLPFVGPVMGLVLAWLSGRWTTAEKWIATALVVLQPVVVLLVALSIFVVFPVSSSNSSTESPVPAPSISVQTPGSAP